MRNLRKHTVDFLKVTCALIVVPAIVAGVLIAVISLVTAIFNYPDWKLIGGLYWFFYIIALMGYSTHLHVEFDRDQS